MGLTIASSEDVLPLKLVPNCTGGSLAVHAFCAGPPNISHGGSRWKSHLTPPVSMDVRSTMVGAGNSCETVIRQTNRIDCSYLYRNDPHDGEQIGRASCRERG